MSPLKTYQNYADNPTRVNALFSDIMGEKPLEKKAIFFPQKHKIQVEFSKKVRKENRFKKKNKNWP